tara:strand:- start:2521 stop:3417 length:897 start_codon:yes stop_codon:yes gene_type:complete
MLSKLYKKKPDNKSYNKSLKIMSTSLKQTWSLTVGNGGENHTGMEFLGNLRKEGQGWDIEKLRSCKKILENIFGKQVELINLNEVCLKGVNIPEGSKPKDAYLMVVRNFLSEDVHENFIKELKSYEWDRKYWDTRRKKVLNKLARANVCYGKQGRVANYEEKKGTIIGFDQSPLVGNLLDIIQILMKEKDLIVEGNQYDDVNKNGIGAHGDTERVCVACLRVGASMPMKYGMFWKNKMRGKSYQTVINGGDLYFMSEEAVGASWKSSSKWIWRHSAGAPKYLKMKGEGEETCYPKFEK